MTIMASNTATLYVRCDLSNYDGNRNITITWDYIPAGATRVVRDREDSSYLNILESALVNQHERWHSVAICVGQPPERDQLVHLLINHKHKYDECHISFLLLHYIVICVAVLFGKNVAADQGNQEMPARAVEKYSVSTNDELYYLISLNC